MPKKVSDNLAYYFFNEGTNYHAYEYLGAHPVPGADACTYVFRVWAPNADCVSLCGDFCSWDEGIAMHPVENSGIWECTAQGVHVYDCYKFRITNGDKVLYKADPYAFHAELPPGTASKVYDISGYEWHDDAWMEHRRKEAENGRFSRPLNIYELHLGSWKLHDDGNFYSYRDLARELVPYVKQMGYTHVELMPVMEHPFDGSWGYQVTGYYAPTSRYGTPHDFMAFVDILHSAGVGVILDWVPAHFPKDAHGLCEFDGVPLYEYQGKDRMEHEGWGTRRFDVGRNEVECFLVSNADYWAGVYHCDGLRVDAVASMLYLDYDKKPGEWVPNIYGENKCLEAIAFFQKLNSHMAGSFPELLMIAEESTAYANVTRFENGGLGFTYKWNMGWMNDVLDYCATDPLFRKGKHGQMTFSLCYAFSENYILPISHDEVVHGKKSLLDRMPGEYGKKFATARAFQTYMMTHPGKKLHFMGNEIGQFREWDYKGQIEWFLLDYDLHRKLQRFHADLNNLYLSRCELWEQDTSWAGFDWLMADNCDNSIFAYMRYNSHGDGLLTVLNFTPNDHKGFKVGFPYEATLTELINSDDEKYGGGGMTNPKKLRTKKEPFDGREYSLTFDLPPLSGVILEGKRVNRKPKKTPDEKEKK